MDCFRKLKFWVILAGSVLATAAMAAAPQYSKGSMSVVTTAAAQLGSKAKTRVVRKKAKPLATRRIVASRPSFGELQGLHGNADPLELRSAVALVIDQDTSEVLLSKNANAVLPIASITKLMTSLIVVEAGQPMSDLMLIDPADIDTEKGSRSRLAIGTELTRGEMLHLALMASENRAANALGRYYPGGVTAIVAAMNRKAAELGMHGTRFVETTGLSSLNQSNANDLARLVIAAHTHPVLRELSTSQQLQVPVGQRVVQYRNSNGLIRDPEWAIGLQKTGYISEAGRCLVMQVSMTGRKLVMVLLDSAGKLSRIGDAERIKRWLGTDPVAATAALTRQR